MLLLFASYFFYACWDYRFLSLLVVSTLFDYVAALKIFHSHGHSRRLWLWSSVALNLGLLAVFKYYNFFVSSFAEALTLVGFQSDLWMLQIILPLGISFYTFHGLSYVLDVYNKKIDATTNLLDYAVFVGFFPLLVAGPIERAAHLLPQIQQPRTFKYEQATDALRQIAWGLFKKIVVADNCAYHVNAIFNGYDVYNGSTVALGVLLFAFQIYGDFSGYSDIAIGVARLMGFGVLRNFAFPYFSRNVAEFWRRWHISLTSWLRDYVYISLGGSRGPRWKVIRNVFVIFLLSGLWHGANWTFIAWGFVHALYFLPRLIFTRNTGATFAYGTLAQARQFFHIALTFLLTTFAWIFFRAQTLGDAFRIVGKIFSPSFLSLPQRGVMVLPFVFIMLASEWIQRDKQHALQVDVISVKGIRWSLYMLVILVIFCFGASGEKFIYFQF